MKPDSGKRIFYYDFLRVISALAVVWIHTSGISVGTQPVGSSAWLVSLFYDAGVHWAVPIFVMISGVLFLGSDKKSNWKVMLTKNIRQLVKSLQNPKSVFRLFTFLQKDHNSSEL